MHTDITITTNEIILISLAIFRPDLKSEKKHRQKCISLCKTLKNLHETDEVIIVTAMFQFILHAFYVKRY